MNGFDLKYICPKCKVTGLEIKRDTLVCPVCNASLAIENNIVDFGAGMPYYGEVPREQMRAIVEEAKGKGWKKALYDNFFKSYNYLYSIAAYETRADWLFLLDLNKEHVVLDVGSGWGSEAVPLARNAGAVVALDGTMERLEFLVVRAEQEQISNVIGVRGSILSPPLTSEQFDLVVMNGVLEWMGHADNTTDPLDLQKQALANAFGLLKKGGRLYLGIENSHGFKYLLGEPDDHTGVRNISFLKRDEAGKLMQAVKGMPYRTYTHSCSGYEKLLREAGFEAVEFYYPVPDYKIFSVVAPLWEAGPYSYYLECLDPDSEPGGVRQNVKNLEKAALESGELRGRTASYSIIAGKA